MKIKKIEKIWIILIIILLLATPILVQGNLYFVGGDDTRLYYIFPQEFLENFAFNIISDNALGGANTGYYPTSHLIPFLLVIRFLKSTIPVNTQNLMSGLNYALGFLFFYLFLSIWFKSVSFYNFFSKITSSLFYVLSPFLVGTLYKNQLMAIYWVSLMPAVFFLFTKGVLEKKYAYSILAALIISVFSTTLNTLPWSVPILITGLPILLFIFVKHKKSFIVNSLILVALLLILNFHWLFHFLNSNLNNTGIAGSFEYFSTEEFEKENIRGILGVSRLLNPLVPLVLKVDYQFLQNFRLTDLRNIIFIGTIAFAGTLLVRDKGKKFDSIYMVGLSGLLLSWFLFSPNFGNWGPEIFLKFATTLPFGTMFRNMFDKFSLPLAFYYSFSLAASLFILEKAMKRKSLKKFLLTLLFLVVVSNSGSFIKPRVLSEGTLGTVTGEFNQDFMDLVEYLTNLENASRILWIPMTSPNFVSVEDRNLEGHYYSGLSPLRVLAGRGDYAGRFSFLLQSDVYFGDKLLELLKESEYEEFAANMKKMNARYIILDKQELPPSMRPYLYDIDMKFLKFQNDEFKNKLLGKKVRDFGNRYTLYEINEKYLSDRIYLTDSLDSFPQDANQLRYQKIKSYLYEIKIANLNKPRKLVFSDPFYSDWVLYLKKDGLKVPFKKGENVIVHNWANGWEINPEEIKSSVDKSFYNSNPEGGVDLVFELYFEPQKYNNKLYYLTVAAYGASMLYIAIYFVLSLRKK